MSLIYETASGELYTDNFSVYELRCGCKKCRKKVPHKMHLEALERLQCLRIALGRAYVPRSCYRCEEHPDESKKDTPGTHNKGLAMDIPVAGGAQRLAVITHAVLLGATGIGVAKTFVHVDFYRPGPSMAWKY